jgi:hypothetical protein
MNVRIICAATVVLTSMVALASANEVSKSTLSGMGLGSMQQLSDNDGLAIRGKGTSASVWGEGTANYQGQTSTNGYQAASSHHKGPSSAEGKNVSFAGLARVKFTSNSDGSSLTVRANLGVAGGFSSASAH